MAEIKILKIGASDEFNDEHDSASDQLTLSGLTVDNTNGVTVTSGVSITADITFNAADDTIAGIENQNLLDKTADETITGGWDFSGGDFIFPTAAASVPSEGDSYWDATEDKLYVYDGSAYVDVGASGSADSVQVNFTAGTGGIAAGDAVYISANDTVLKAQADATATSRLIGFAPSAITAAASGPIKLSGVAAGVLTGATANDPYYLSAATAGEVTATKPTGSGNRVVLAGFAKNATDLLIRIENLGKRA